MTFIAFSTGSNRADIVTDTWCYTRIAESMAHTSKVRPLLHLDTAVVTQGDAIFGALARAAADQSAALAPDFDTLVDGIPSVLQKVWQTVIEGRDMGAIDPGVVYVIGHSSTEQRFIAHRYSAEDAFVDQRVAEAVVMPSPFTVRPSDWELRTFEHNDVWGDPESPNHDLLEPWSRKPAFVAPVTGDGWVRLAELARAHRTIGAHPYSGAKVFVGGELHHTVLRRGEVATRRMHRFNDSGDEFKKIMLGTRHPLGQASPCPCGSDERYVDCGLQLVMDEPCGCQSGRAFGECCSIAPASDEGHAGVSELAAKVS